MLRHYALVLVALSGLAPTAPAQVLYPFAIGGSSNQGADAVAVGADGTAFVAGALGGTADFDPSAAAQPRTSNGALDVFLASYTADGAFRWAFNIGATTSETVRGVAATTDGGVVIVGHFDSNVDFDPGAGSDSLRSVGGTDVFVAKYAAADGALRWAVSVGGLDADFGNAVAATADGGVVLTGSFGSPADFDPGAGTFPLLGEDDAYILQLDASGAFVRAFDVGAQGSEVGRTVAVDGTGRIVVGGTFEDTVDFDPGSGTAEVVSGGKANGYIAAYDAAGAFRWAGGLVSPVSNTVTALATTADGSVVATGAIAGASDFDFGAGATTLTPASSSDLFVARYAADGALQGAFAVAGNSIGLGVALAADGRSVVTGAFNSEGEGVDFDPGAGQTLLTGVKGDEVFVASYDAGGALRYAFAVVGEGLERGTGVAVDAQGNALVGGAFSSESAVDFDPGPGTLLLTSGGASDAFVAKYGPTGSLYTPVASEPGATFDGARLSAPSPNPSRHDARFTLVLPTPQAVRVDLFDALGRRVATLHDGVLAAGPHPFMVAGSRLPSGVYVVRAVGSSFALTQRLTLVR